MRSIGYIGYEKAFDTVGRNNLFKALYIVGINQGYVQLLANIYTNASGKIYIENDVSEDIQIERGVRHGDAISPKMFTAAMEEIFKKLNLQDRWLNINVNKLRDLWFAGDVALITSLVDDMDIQLNDMNKESKRLDSKFSKGKQNI